MADTPEIISRLQRSHRLARAFKRLDRAEELAAAARAAFDVEFGPWSAGRSINRDEAREHLVSTGLLEPRKEKKKR